MKTILMIMGVVGLLASVTILGRFALSGIEQRTEAQARSASWIAKVQDHNVYKLVDGINCIYIVVNRADLPRTNPTVAVAKCY